jgi:hypothetical protein
MTPMKMKDYVLHFIQTHNLVDKNISSFWRCSADNYKHAVEQLRDEIERNQGERLIFVEHYKLAQSGETSATQKQNA